MRIKINNKEITNPFARALIAVVALTVVVLMLLLVLPLIGIVFAVSLGIFLGVFAAMLAVVFIGVLFSKPRKANLTRLEKPKDE